MNTLDRFAHRLKDSGLTVAVAESLTCGRLASALGSTSSASDWFRGGVTAYDDDVKHRVLGVKRGPVINRETAQQMAESVRDLMDADIALAVTGVGGPGHTEDQPAGTVFIAVASKSGTTAREHRFPGTPDAVLDATILAVVELAMSVNPFTDPGYSAAALNYERTHR